MRYFIRLSYDGSQYHGWQSQPNAVTVQETIEKVIEKITRSKIILVGCGRTDTSVHALQYVAHIDMEEEFTLELLYKINKVLPDNIVVHEFQPVHDDFHARYSAYSRSYVYFIHREKNPFLRHSYYVPWELDIAILSDIAKLVCQTNDFESFCKSHSDVQHYLCDIRECYWKETAFQLEFHITANRFLRGMIRLIVGACLNVARGNVALSNVKKALFQKYPMPQPWSVPGHALFLRNIQYPGIIWEKEVFDFQYLYS